jgi:hypothetical protein
MNEKIFNMVEPYNHDFGCWLLAVSLWLLAMGERLTANS